MNNFSLFCFTFILCCLYMSAETKKAEDNARLTKRWIRDGDIDRERHYAGDDWRRHREEGLRRREEGIRRGEEEAKRGREEGERRREEGQRRREEGERHRTRDGERRLY
uniref:Uncharacterized protein n=1 Tax=Pristhesancus plagipennis TaxID=1955184 RepID=A0A2K8JMX1_PRIPG|nr:secreted hypothetical protein [Pristhesancus plagipennis]